MTPLQAAKAERVTCERARTDDLRPIGDGRKRAIRLSQDRDRVDSMERGETR
jgi:hypothetical protein